MSLKYALVARDTSVLCDYSAELGAFRSVAVGLLEKIPARTDRCSFPYDGNLYSFLVEGGFAFGVVGLEGKKQLAFGFLEKVKGEFMREVGTAGLDAAPGELDSTFGKRLKYWMEYCVKNPDELSKIGGLQKKVDDIKTIMLGNIEEVIKRGEKLQDLDTKAELLSFEADKFKSSGVALRKKMWWQKAKWQVVAGIAGAVVLLIIILIIYYAVK